MNVLKEAANLLRTHGWTQHAYARDLNGNALDYDSPSAACFCMRGAIARAQLNAGIEMEDGCCGSSNDFASRVFYRRHGREMITLWNDDPSRTADEVITELETIASIYQESNA